MITKHFRSSSVGVLLEKVYEMFWHEFFSKATSIQLKNNFSIYFFLENFEKCPEKNKLSEKLLTGLVSINIFTDMF